MRVSRSLVVLRALLLTVGFAGASAGSMGQPLQKVDPARSEILFTSKQMGVPVQGRFQRFEAQLNLDPQHPETGRASLSVDLGSATMGVPESDLELAKPAWFNASKFPKAQFVSSGVKALGAGRYVASGKLSLKGQQQDVVVPFQLKTVGTVTEATGAFTLKRLDFKVGDGEWADTSLVANDVQVQFKLSLVR